MDNLEIEILKAKIITLALELNAENSLYFFPSENAYNKALEEFGRLRREYIECTDCTRKNKTNGL